MVVSMYVYVCVYVCMYVRMIAKHVFLVGFDSFWRFWEVLISFDSCLAALCESASRIVRKRGSQAKLNKSGAGRK